MKNDRTRLSMTLAAVLGLSFAGCYPTAGYTSASQYDTVATAHDATAGFAGYSTFSVPGFPDGGIPELIPDGGTATTVNHSYDPFILQTIVSNFTAAGYTNVPPGTMPPPSFTVFVGVNASTYTQYYYPWYYYWGAYYPPGYPWYGYPWYPYPVYSQYDVGTLLLNMTVPDAPNSKLNGVWTAALRGILSPQATTASQNARLLRDINQAFLQSPYLKRSSP
jgi:hypothetical protein